MKLKRGLVTRKKYNIIYADPPWNFKVWSKRGEGRSASQHYPVMDLAQITALPVESIAADDCVLFLWVTNPLLQEGLSVMKSWGFKYKTVGFHWIKTNRVSDGYFMGTGYWTRANPEICLLGTRGKPSRVDMGVRSLVVEPIRRHSAKPERVRIDIVRLLGNVPRIELFARDKVKGWDAWGNEIRSDIIL